jgi:hypothetical protein
VKIESPSGVYFNLDFGGPEAEELDGEVGYPRFMANY